MPELPEVESIRLSLLPRLVGRRVVGAVLHRRDVLVAPGDPYGGFARQRGAGRGKVRPNRVSKAELLEGAVVTRIERRGKQLAIIAESATLGREIALGVQFGMSGQLFHRAAGQRVADASHIHAEWRLKDGGRLVFRDPRRFGGLRSFPSLEALQEHWAALGADALHIGGEELAAALKGSGRAIKAALLDQSVAAGVGNIYADEALFAAQIAPARRAADLTRAECVRLAETIREVLANAIEAGGSTLRDYVDADGNPGSFQLAHKVYGRAGEACVACGAELSSTVLAQRMTVWCSRCQGGAAVGKRARG